MKFRGLLSTLFIGGLLTLPMAAQAPASPPAAPSPEQSQTSPSQMPETQVNEKRTTGKKTDADHTGHVAGAAGEESMVGKTDHAFMTKAAKGGMMEVHLADLAQEKAASEEVKSYAKKLKADHEKANTELKQIAQKRGISLPSDMGEHQQQVQKLNNLSGEEFDRAYMKMQVQHHKKDIKEFQKASNRSMDTNLKEFASAQLPTLQEHLRQAEQLSASTGTRGRKSDTGKMDSNKTTSGTTSEEKK